MQRECNYLQALEGDLDTSHAGFLHLGGGMGVLGDVKEKSPESISISTLDPEFRVMDTDCGVMAGAYRPADAQSAYWRFTNFLLPFFSQVPALPVGRRSHPARLGADGRPRITMFFSITTETSILQEVPTRKSARSADGSDDELQVSCPIQPTGMGAGALRRISATTT